MDSFTGKKYEDKAREAAIRYKRYEAKGNDALRKKEYYKKQFNSGDVRDKDKNAKLAKKYEKIEKSYTNSLSKAARDNYNYTDKAYNAPARKAIRTAENKLWDASFAVEDTVTKLKNNAIDSIMDIPNNVVDIVDKYVTGSSAKSKLKENRREFSKMSKWAKEDRESANKYNNYEKAYKQALDVNRKHGAGTYDNMSDRYSIDASIYSLHDKDKGTNENLEREYRYAKQVSDEATERAKEHNLKAKYAKKRADEYQNEYDKSLAGKAEKAVDQAKSRIKTTKNHIKRKLSK